jgi:hypothetical protein
MGHGFHGKTIAMPTAMAMTRGPFKHRPSQEASRWLVRLDLEDPADNEILVSESNLLPLWPKASADWMLMGWDGDLMNLMIIQMFGAFWFFRIHEHPTI